ncbi:uncharacterized protein LOC132178994 isoform X2 [Corylus avellana]|uniref:uncharacterized protein LOC132178994 isoform X2 n=1 Tax=Corylus avellana TaxID=13451 RepID=UPI00286ABEB7|nr:uncharacterized protein LOC132178994 isoform X2 [Corylus avellana]
MGIVGILMFALNFLHLFAWPLLALGYPLFASIRAIERDSNWETKKLVTYWISFSLLSLFDHSFVNLLQWIKFWRHIKLMIICLLVIPYFNGAFYVYNHLVRPYLLLNPQVIVDEFRKWMVLLCKRDQFLAEAERYIKGNGPKALEKLIDKEFETQKPNVDVEEIKAIATATEKKEVEWSYSKEPDILEIDNKAVEVTEKKEVPAANQLTTESEKTLNMHLQEKKHKATYEALKGKNQSNIINFGSVLPVLASTIKTTYQPMENPQKIESTNGLRGSTTTNHDEKGQGQPKSVLSSTAKESDQPTKQIFVPERSLDPTDNRTSTTMEIEGPDVAVAAPRELPDIHVFKEVQKEWTGAICQVTTESEKPLNIHLQEKKHKATYEALKGKNQPNIVNFGSFLTVLASTTETTDQPIQKPQKIESTNGLRGSTTTNHDEKGRGQPKSVLSSTAEESNQPTKQIFVPERSLDPTDNRTSTTMEIEGPDVAVAAPRELPDIHVFKEVQKEWTCAICQVTTSSKITLNMHRKGKKHKATIEALKAKNQPNFGLKQKIILTDKEKTLGQQKNAKKEAIRVKNSTFKCYICNVNCTGKIDLASHLRGKKHLEQVQVFNGKILGEL